MSLESEIKQTKPFKNEKEKAVVNIIYTNNWVNHSLKILLKPHEVTIKQYNILRILKGQQKAMTTSEIRSRMIDKMSDITRLIERLIKKDLVIKSISDSDKRLVDITLTAKGDKVLTRVSQQKNPLYMVLNNLTEEESRTLNSLLDKIRSTDQ